MSDMIVTKEDIRDLIRTEKLRPEDLFDADVLKELTAQARAEGYGEAVMRHARPKEEADKPKQDEKTGPEKFLDPATNPLIKTD